MRAALLLLFITPLWLWTPGVARAKAPPAYGKLRQAISVEQRQARQDLGRLPRAERRKLRANLEARLLKRTDQLHEAWLAGKRLKILGKP